jgi:hypothetical protein
MDLHRIPQWICIGQWSLIHFSYHACWLVLLLPKFIFLLWSDAHESFGVEWIVWFIVGSICTQFCSCWCDNIIRIWFWLIHWLFFFCCIFWRSGLSECWIRSYVRGRQYGCTLYRKMLGFICPLVVSDSTNGHGIYHAYTWFILGIYYRPYSNVTGTEMSEKVLSRCMPGIYCISSYERFKHVLYQVLWGIYLVYTIYQ